MESKYSLNTPEEHKLLAENYEAFNQLMGTIEFSGVLSDVFITRIFQIANTALRCKIKRYETEKLLQKELLQKVALKYFEDFRTILNIFSIFSEPFKKNLLNIFLRIITNYETL